MKMIGFVMTCLPIIMMGTGIYLIGLGIYRNKRKMTYSFILASGIILFLIPIFAFVLLCLGVVFSGT